MEKSIWDILDEKASGVEYVTLEEVISAYYGKAMSKHSKATEYEAVKQWLNRHKWGVEYKNGKDLSGGFRYKLGYEEMHKVLEEEKKLGRLNGDAYWLLRTGGLPSLFEGQTELDPLVELEFVQGLQNINVVKELSKHVGKRVISFKYHQGFQNDMDIKMHPHLLKEYNSRWFLIGYVMEESGYLKVVNFAIDRIDPSSIRPLIKETFERAKRHFYRDYFKDIVGVTKFEDKQVETITIRTVDYKVHHLLKSKPIHPSQQMKADFDEKTQMGEFTIQVIPNIELQTKLLGYGPGLYVVGNGTFQQQVRKAVENMYKLYNT